MKRPPHFTLELLRGGPPHNQLVSQITEYLALCGDAAPFTLRLPFEHRDLMNSLRMLRYDRSVGENSEIFRKMEMERLGHQLGGLLGTIPAFAAEMSSIDIPTNGDVVHLRLVLAGNELSLVPWEVAQVPDGLPGAGLSLLLQPRVPISMTREVRGASRRQFEWDRVPHVLFASADRGDFPPNTLEAHLLALRRALESWTYQQWWTNGWRKAPYPIDIIERASVEDIRRKCVDGDYTHIHILAHGKRLGPGDEARFGLYLHQSGDRSQREVVTGEQLAHALLPSRSHRGASDPLMVILATCDSANQGGDVVNPGGSVAHVLHQMGVPWVVASQFPLTVTGSVILTGDLYNELFDGTDPRMALHRVRQHLATRFGDRHDWATLVGYASFPPDFDRQIENFRLRALREQRNRVFALVDRLVLDWIRKKSPAGTSQLAETETIDSGELPSLDEVHREVKAALTALEREQAFGAKDEGSKVEQLLKAADWALRAATRKRLAEVQYLKGMAPAIWKETLEGVWEDYKKGLQQGIQVDHWILVQYFVMRLVVGKITQRPKILSAREEIFWNQAIQSVKLDLISDDPEDRMWARASWVDLLMVALADWEDREKKWESLGFSSIEPEDVLRELISMVDESGKDYSCPAVWPTFRQFWRWHRWWSDVAKPQSDIEVAAQAGYAYLWEKVDERQRQSADPSPN